MGLKHSTKTGGVDPSDFKLFSYLLMFIKEPVNITINGESTHRDAVHQFKIKPSFWLEDHCNCCGRCCKNLGMAYFETEIENIKNSNNPNKNIILSRVEPTTIILNGKAKIFYNEKPIPDSQCIRNTTEGRNFVACPYVDKKSETLFLCKIHNIRSFTCKFPHIELTFSKDRQNISMHTAQYGRNHQLKCYAQFTEPTLLGVKNKLDILKDFYNKTQYLEVNTWLPEIIQFIESNMETFAKKGFPTQDVIFTLSNKRKLF